MVHTLSIKKDTFSGSINGVEGGGKSPHVPKNPKPH